MKKEKMRWPKLLALVRHAESEGNIRTADERAEYDVASYEYAITERGRKQAEITREYLQKNFGTFDAHYTSYYRRAKETMGILCPGTEVREDPRLAEAQRGIWHTMIPKKVMARFPEELARKEREGLYHYRPFGGENWPDIELRIHSFLNTLSRDHSGQKVLIVVHAHWLILFQRLMEGFSIDEAVARYKSSSIENASITTFNGRIHERRSRLLLAKENIIPWLGQL